MNREIHKSEIENLQDGERYIIPESDYGKAEVWKVYEVYFLFDIPQYGGKPIFHNSYSPHMIDEMLDEIDSWV